MTTVPSKSAYMFDRQPRFYLGAFRLLCVNTAFLRKFAPILTPEHWSEMEAKWVIREVVDHYEEYGRAPRFQTMRMRLDADTRLKPEQEELIGRWLNKLDSFELDDSTRAYIHAKFEAWVCYRVTLHALRMAHEYLQEDEWDAAVEVVQNSQRVRLVDDEGSLRVVADMPSLLAGISEQNLLDHSVPTGINPLDDRLGGGVRPGELAVWLAPTGFGKSMALVHVGAAAVQRGLSVVHFTLENSKEETFARYASNMLDTDSKVLARLDKDADAFVRRYAELGERGTGDVHVQQVIGSDTSARDLRSMVERLRDDDFGPDLIIVDYGDLLRPGRRTRDKYDDQQTIFEELRDLAAATGLPLWTATQGNRKALSSSSVSLEHVADSIGKAMVADIVVSVGKPNDKAIARVLRPAFDLDCEDEEGRERLRVLRLLKLRRGEAGLSVVVRERFSRASFEVVDDD